MQDSADARQAPAGKEWGWYLYGITRSAGQASNEGDAGVPVAPDDTEHMETISSGDLLAIVRRVPLAEFSVESLQAHADDLAWIEAVARRHNAAIERIHRTQTVLPAKFGSVYERADDVREALREEHDTLLERLSWLDGCDEWGVRLYADAATIQRRADAEQSDAQSLRQELASASPGRAYFLQRKLADELVEATERLLDDLVEQAYERFARHAKAGQVSWTLAGSRINLVNLDEESAEILRAAFLVSRESADAFIEDVRGYAESQPGLSCEYSGPWPPYSFAAQLEPTEEE